MATDASPFAAHGFWTSWGRAAIGRIGTANTSEHAREADNPYVDPTENSCRQTPLLKRAARNRQKSACLTIEPQPRQRHCLTP